MEEEKINVKEIKEELKESLNDTYCDCICDYDSGYICDIISEISDSHVDIYYYNLFEWAKNNFSIIEEANEELGAPNDITKQIQQGQYIQYEREMYDNIDDMIQLFIYDYIYNDLNIEEITEEQKEEIDVLNYDNNDKLENIIDDINEILKELKNEGDDE